MQSCRDRCSNYPWLKPLSAKNQLLTLPQTFHIDIPDALVEDVQKCKNNKEARQVGVEWAIEQCKELVANDVPVLHFFTMGRTDNIEKIVKEVL